MEPENQTLKESGIKAGGPREPGPEPGTPNPDGLQALVKRLGIISGILTVISIILILVLTNKIIYSIIFFLGTAIGVSGFWLMGRMVDRYLTRGKGQGWYFLAGLAKMTVIAAAFFLASRISSTAVLIYILGLLVIVAAMMVDAVRQLFRSGSKHGRT